MTSFNWSSVVAAELVGGTVVDSHQTVCATGAM